MLSIETRQSIDAGIETVQQYTSAGKVDYARLANDKGIVFLETHLFASSLSVRHENQNYVFGARHYVPFLREYELAHEFGHVLLGHTDHSNPKTERVMEVEADYFAEQVTGLAHWKSRLIRIPEILTQLVFNPVSALRYPTPLLAVDIAQVIRLLNAYQDAHSMRAAVPQETVNQ